MNIKLNLQKVFDSFVCARFFGNLIYFTISKLSLSFLLTVVSFHCLRFSFFLFIGFFFCPLIYVQQCVLIVKTILEIACAKESQFFKSQIDKKEKGIRL